MDWMSSDARSLEPAHCADAEHNVSSPSLSGSERATQIFSCSGRQGSVLMVSHQSLLGGLLATVASRARRNPIRQVAGVGFFTDVRALAYWLERQLT